MKNSPPIVADSKLLLAPLPLICWSPDMIPQKPNSDPQAPAEVHGDPVTGASGFLVARPSLWFTPRRILARICPEEPPLLLANPPFGSPIGIR